MRYRIDFNKKHNGFPNIELVPMILGDIAKGFIDESADESESVTTMDGRLNIRPAYQRNYIHDEQDRWVAELIESVANNMPINTLYLGVLGDGCMEVVDGQQRLYTLCKFISGNLTIYTNEHPMGVTFDGLDVDIKERIRNYELNVALCHGTSQERLNWFITINKPASILSRQELRNASYTGDFINYLRKKFSNSKSAIVSNKNSIYHTSYYGNSLKYERQDFVELVLDWVSYYEWYHKRLNDGNAISKDDRINMYMSIHQNNANGEFVYEHYKKVCEWIHNTFFDGFDGDWTKCQSLKSVEWGRLYAEHENDVLDTKYITKRVHELLAIQQEFSKPSGLYEWVLLGERDDNFNLMSPRAFKPEIRKRAYNLQGGFDPFSNEHFDSSDDMVAHHIISWKDGGCTNLENCVLVSEETHQRIHTGHYNNKEVREKLNELLERVKRDKEFSAERNRVNNRM